MSILCWFTPCRWTYMFNAERWFASLKGGQVRTCGVYQCSRCKALSIGSAKPFMNEPRGIINDNG